MKSRRLALAAAGALMLAGCLVTTVSLQAQLRVSGDDSGTVVFGGQPQTISVRVHRPPAADPTAEVDAPVGVEVWYRLFQEASGVAVPLGPPQLWKLLRSLPGQTVLESASIEFPSVDQATAGLVRWETAEGQGLGSTRLWVVPSRVLVELRTLAEQRPVGVTDWLSPGADALRQAGVPLENLAELPQTPQAGLIVVLPGPLAEAQPAPLARRVDSWTASGRKVIWLKSEDPVPGWTGPWAEVRPGRNARVVADARTLGGLETASAQWRLVALARWACRGTTEWKETGRE